MLEFVRSVLAFVIWAGLASGGMAQELPNVVLMMGDDHGWEETGYNGHPYLKTPTLDEMAITGLRFNHFHAAHANCSPTRASFLTGRHPNRMGTFSPGYSFRPEELTIAHLLNKAGYYCGHFGKWHVGPVKAESPVCPGKMGFQEWLSHDNFFEINPTLSRNGGPPQVIQGESSEVLVAEAISFMERARVGEANQRRPFLAVIWFGSPHEPYSGLPQDLALYDQLPTRYNSKKVNVTSNETGKSVTRNQGEVLRERYAEITAMDRSIGRLREYLRNTGQRDNTLLFYCGDNGTSADGLLKSPHRGHKGDIYEGGSLVPGLIEWPARIQPNQVSEVHACTSDLLPTLAKLVNQELPARPIDGIDLTGVLENRLVQRPEPLCFWQFNVQRYQADKPSAYMANELQRGTTPLVKRMGGKATRDFVNYRHPSIQPADFKGPRAIIDGHYKLIVHETQESVEYELFDLSTDPGETRNLTDLQNDRVKAMSDRLRQWQQNVLESLMGADYSQPYDLR